ncbi:MAG: hypothetical protein GY788_01090 [bacterium]|nr:hypothetical protein [bacterium]
MNKNNTGPSLLNRAGFDSTSGHKLGFFVSNPGGVGLLDNVEHCLELCWGSSSQWLWRVAL